MAIGHGFSFFGHGKVMEKSWKINFEKEGAPCKYNLLYVNFIRLIELSLMSLSCFKLCFVS